MDSLYLVSIPLSFSLKVIFQPGLLVILGSTATTCLRENAPQITAPLNFIWWEENNKKNSGCCEKRKIDSEQPSNSSVPPYSFTGRNTKTQSLFQNHTHDALKHDSYLDFLLILKFYILSFIIRTVCSFRPQNETLNAMYILHSLLNQKKDIRRN